MEVGGLQRVTSVQTRLRKWQYLKKTLKLKKTQESGEKLTLLKKASKTQAIRLWQFHSIAWDKFKILPAISQSCSDSSLFCLSFVINMKSSSLKLSIFSQLIYYLPKPGPISKHGLNKRGWGS